MAYEPDDFEIIKMTGRFPTPPRYEVDLELLDRRLAMTPAERAENMYKVKRLMDRFVKRIRDKYAITVRFQ